MSVEFSLLGIAFWKRFCLVDKHFVPFPLALPFREGRSLLRGGFRKPCVISVNTTSCVKPKRGPQKRGPQKRGPKDVGHKDVGVNSYAVGRRRPVSTFVEKD